MFKALSIVLVSLFVMVGCGESTPATEKTESGVSAAQGQSGEDGDRGADGRDGKDGKDAVGERGEKGEKGEPGTSVVGPKGDKGDPGETVVGPMGPQGDPGVPGVGIAGPVGPKGDKGEAGGIARAKVYMKSAVSQNGSATVMCIGLNDIALNGGCHVPNGAVKLSASYFHPDVPPTAGGTDLLGQGGWMCGAASNTGAITAYVTCLEQ